MQSSVILDRTARRARRKENVSEEDKEERKQGRSGEQQKEGKEERGSSFLSFSSPSLLLALLLLYGTFDSSPCDDFVMRFLIPFATLMSLTIFLLLLTDSPKVSARSAASYQKRLRRRNKAIGNTKRKKSKEMRGRSFSHQPHDLPSFYPQTAPKRTKKRRRGSGKRGAEAAGEGRRQERMGQTPSTKPCSFKIVGEMSQQPSKITR